MNKNINFFKKLFLRPTITWVIISLIALIPDETDKYPLTIMELITADIALVIIWFVISCIIYFVYNKVTNQKDEYKDKGVKIYHTYKFKKNAMLCLFIFTIISFFLATSTWDYLDSKTNINIVNINKNAWTMYLWLPIPITSIILGIKYKYMGFKCTKNIVAGFIVSFLLIGFGSLYFVPTFEENYQNIYDYSNILNIKLPKNGVLSKEDGSVYFNEDKKDYLLITAYYDEENTNELTTSIKNNSDWVLSLELKSNLKIFIPDYVISGEDVYFSIYNETTNEYNKVPDMLGEYQIYTMKYDISDKQLQIHKFNYDYN